MGFEGKLTRSRQKQDFANQLPLGVGFKNLVFAHKFTTASSIIDLTALNTPSASEIPNFVNPSVASLLAANIVAYGANMTLTSSSGGTLIPGLEYQITSNSTIRLTNAALIGTIIYGTMSQVAETGIQVISGQPIIATGVLAVGQTQINVGTPFATNANPNYNMGVVQVTRNGLVLKRNTGNSSTNLDKDYYELPTSLGASSVIVLNRSGELLPDESFEEWSVASFGPIADVINGSNTSLIQSLAAQINAVVPILSDIAGVPQSTFTTNPSQVDLRQFGDLVGATAALANQIPAIKNGTRGAREFRVGTPNGVGSTNTAIRRYSSVYNSAPWGTFVDSATLGSSITINQAGLYFVKMTDRSIAAGTNVFGPSLNTTAPSSDIFGISEAERLAVCIGTTSGATEVAAGMAWLSQGDIIRGHTNPAAVPTSTEASMGLTIVQIIGS
jgi:hypothetical protein